MVSGGNPISMLTLYVLPVNGKSEIFSHDAAISVISTQAA